MGLLVVTGEEEGGASSDFRLLAGLLANLGVEELKPWKNFLHLKLRKGQITATTYHLYFSLKTIFLDHAVQAKSEKRYNPMVENWESIECIFRCEAVGTAVADGDGWFAKFYFAT